MTTDDDLLDWDFRLEHNPHKNCKECGETGLVFRKFVGRRGVALKPCPGDSGASNDAVCVWEITNSHGDGTRDLAFSCGHVIKWCGENPAEKAWVYCRSCGKPLVEKESHET